MAQKKRIGILYSYDENWIGGAYYIQNLIRSLNYLPIAEQPFLYIVSKDRDTYEEFKKVTGYSKLEFLEDKGKYNIFERLVNKIAVRLIKKKIFEKTIALDWLFPLYKVPSYFKDVNDIVFWIPDLQDKYLPHFFSHEVLVNRQKSYENMIASNHPIVFSSYSTLSDFNTFYPGSKNKKYILQFAVVHPQLKQIDINHVKLKYNIKGDYFFSPNQFWQHKNQIALIEAAKILKDNGIIVKIILTGKEHDHRNPNYSHNLKQKVIDYKLHEEIIFLGFIDRIDQLVLMENALAIIQPSLFEGWSTVVEDAKALNQTIIASDIPVHKEQLVDKAYFFPKNDYDELARIIVVIIENPSHKLRYTLDYTKNIEHFASGLMNIINDN